MTSRLDELRCPHGQPLGGDGKWACAECEDRPGNDPADEDEDRDEDHGEEPSRAEYLDQFNSRPRYTGRMDATIVGPDGQRHHFHELSVTESTWAEMWGGWAERITEALERYDRHVASGEEKDRG